jgi:hypothetical protein
MTELPRVPISDAIKRGKRGCSMLGQNDGKRPSRGVFFYANFTQSSNAFSRPVSQVTVRQAK